MRGPYRLRDVASYEQPWPEPQLDSAAVQVANESAHAHVAWCGANQTSNGRRRVAHRISPSRLALAVAAAVVPAVPSPRDGLPPALHAALPRQARGHVRPARRRRDRRHAPALARRLRALALQGARALQGPCGQVVHPAIRVPRPASAERPQSAEQPCKPRRQHLVRRLRGARGHGAARPHAVRARANGAHAPCARYRLGLDARRRDAQPAPRPPAVHPLRLDLGHVRRRPPARADHRARPHRGLPTRCFLPEHSFLTHQQRARSPLNTPNATPQLS
jgi:hypothetical protein